MYENLCELLALFPKIVEHMFDSLLGGSMHYQNSRLARARDILVSAEQRLGVSTSDSALVPAALRGGDVYCVEGSVGQMVAALCAGLADDAWCAVVGVPYLGWGAAVAQGFPLERSIVVPDVQGKGEAVLHYLIPHVDVVALGEVRITRAQQQKVAARLRRYRTALVTLTPWPGVSRSLPQGSGFSRRFVGDEAAVGT